MKKFGLIGLPLVHSFSRNYFTTKFEREGIDASYELFELKDIEELTALIKTPDLCGLNVTIPYKEKVIAFLDELDETASEIGAVNVIKFIRSKETLRLKGYNSDAIGFETSLLPVLTAHHKKALILGTGGASKAIDYVLRKQGIETTFVSRTSKPGMLTYSQLNKDLLSDNLLIVNASPVGTFPHQDECPAIPYQFLTAGHVLFDVVYNPAETLFLRKGREKGAVGLNGEGMLTGQAIAAWEIWNAK
ncbi:MAG: shikimate dehydrogenase [Bacteroidota bacterium]|nr:shikimate dehydrogenase [Bacteroidota bacterium]